MKKRMIGVLAISVVGLISTPAMIDAYLLNCWEIYCEGKQFCTGNLITWDGCTIVCNTLGELTTVVCTRDAQ